MISPLCFAFALALSAQDGVVSYPAETYVLENGLRVTLHEDHALPKVVIDTWFAVGSKDEEPGRTGFAHLFEHLMFMGTERVPGSQFDEIMEAGGGFNNATTSQDRTNYFSQGPSALLPTLLWLDADRFETLDLAMTVEKLDAQRDIVQNERRQSIENVPYGRVELLLPELLYPAGHPYRHSVIGSHEDLEAAELADVLAFFRTYYVPANASVVVAGDFEREEAKELIERTLGAIAPKPVPAHAAAEPATLLGETRAVTYDDVELEKLVLVWPSPRAMTEGDAALDVLAAILADGSASRLVERLVIDTGLAQEVDASQASGDLGSEFHVEVLAAPDASLDAIESEVHGVLSAYLREPADDDERGARAAELARVKAQIERGFLERAEDLLARADAMNQYLRAFGVADGFQRDLERYRSLEPEDVRTWAARVLGPGRISLRVLPAGERETGTLAEVSGAGATTWEPAGSLDERPADLAQRAFAPPTPVTRRLTNGIAVHLLERPGTRLFAGKLLVQGGEGRIPAERAGLASLTARMLNQGAAGLDTVAWAEAVESLGASLVAGASRDELEVAVSGLSARLVETLDRFAELVFEPNLAALDFEREKTLVLGDIKTRGDDPRRVAALAARALVFGGDEHRGRPVEGYERTVSGLELSDVQSACPALLDGTRARMVFAGDFDADELVRLLEARFHDLATRVGARGPRDAAHTDDEERAFQTAEPPLSDARAGRIVLVDRPDSPQTVVYLLRPIAPLADPERALCTALNTALGGSFTSRLNMNLRERNGYAYGAGSRIAQEGPQSFFSASASVKTAVTGVALAEFRRELDGIAGGDVTASELDKALESARTDLMESFGTTDAVADAFARLVANGRPLDALARDQALLDLVRLEAANAYARSGLFDWSKLCVVLVGDARTVLPQLEAEGFPAPLRADEEGRLAE